MSHHYNINKISLYVLSFFVVTIFISCGTMQTTSNNNDGIYDDNIEKPQRNVVITNENDYRKYEDNYFTTELKRLDYMNGTDVITDIEDYNSGDYEYIDDSSPENEQIQSNNYNNESWGSNSNADVVVHINGGYNYGFYGWNDPFWGNPWRYRRGLRWGYNSFWHPFHNNYWGGGFYGNVGFYNNYWGPFYGNRGFFGFPYRYGYRNNNRYFRNNGRNAVAYNSRRNTYSRRGNNVSSRRSSNTYNRRSSVSNRSSRNSSSRNNTGNQRSIKRSTNSSRYNSSNNRSRSTNYNRSSRSSSRSSTSGSRGTYSRGSSSSRSSRSRR